MRCDDIKTVLLTDYADGILDTGARKNIDAHLAGCPSCRALADIVLRTGEDLRSTPPTPPPAEVWKDIEERLDEETWADKIRDYLFPGAFLVRASYALATVVVAVLVVTAVGRFTMTASTSTSSMYLALLTDRQEESDLIDEIADDGFGSAIEEEFL